MDSFLVAIIAAMLAGLGFTVGSTRKIDEPNKALIERAGKYHRTLSAGYQIVIPGLDRIVCEWPTSEQLMDIEPQEVITKDKAELSVDAIVYWRVFDLKKAFYEVDDVQKALENLVITTTRAAIGEMELQDTFSSRREINEILVRQLDEVTEHWGVKVYRVEIQNITPSQRIRELLAMENENRIRDNDEREQAEVKRRAMLEEAETKRKVAILEAEARAKSAQAEAEYRRIIAQAEAATTAEYIKQLSEALKDNPDRQEILKFLMNQRYVESNFKLSESPGAKVIFMDPNYLASRPVGSVVDARPEREVPTGATSAIGSGDRVTPHPTTAGGGVGANPSQPLHDHDQSFHDDFHDASQDAPSSA